MRLLFIQVDDCREAFGVEHLSAVLKKNGHHCDLMLKTLEKNYLNKLARLCPDIIGFSATSLQLKSVINTAGEIKKRFDIPVIVGGPHPTFCPEVIENENIDIICRGEAESALLELMNNLEAKEKISQIRNLWVKEGDKVYKNELRPLEDLDKLPFPDRELYFNYNHIRKLGILRILAGRGCPFLCTYCFNKEMKLLYREPSDYIRRRSPEKIIAEINKDRGKYKFRGISFTDDVFTIDKEWLEVFLDIYKKEINIPFFCNSRLELLDVETIKKLKDSGCGGVRIGIESGSERIREEILNRRLADSKIIEIIRQIKKYRMKVFAYNMFGLPTETYKDALKTVELNIKIKPDTVSNGILILLPKLRITDQAIKRGLVDEKELDFKRYERSMILKQKDKERIHVLYCWMPLFIKFPFLIRLSRYLISIKIPKILKIFEAYNTLRFFNISVPSGLRYFLTLIKYENRG